MSTGKKMHLNQVLAQEKKFLLHIDHVFYLRMRKLRCALIVGYMDLKVF